MTLTPPAPVSDRQELGRYEGHTDDTNCLALHNGHLVSGSDDYTVKLWQTTISQAGEGCCVATLVGHEARVWCVLASEDYIYSCSADKSILVWSMRDAQRGIATQAAKLTGHTDVVYSVELALGALFSCSADKTVKRYDLSTHRQSLSWEAHAHSVTCLAASASMNVLCSGAEDGRCADHRRVSVAQGVCGGWACLCMDARSRPHPSPSRTLAESTLLVATGSACGTLARRRPAVLVL